MPTIVDYKFVSQDTKFGEYIALVNRTIGNNFDQNNYIYRLFQKMHPILILSSEHFYLEFYEIH